MKLSKKILGRNEFYIFLTIMLICILVQVRSGQFFTGNNIVDIMRALVVPGMFAVAEYIIIISGGIDVSFPALSSLAIYATTRMLVDSNYQGGILLPLLMVVALGVILGALNGAFISFLGLPPLIVTLGTQSVFRGIMQGALNSVQIPKLPTSMQSFGASSLFTATNPVSGLSSSLPSLFLLLVALLIAMYLLLRYTMFGRGVFAVGGDASSALRAGFNVKGIKFSLYCISGVIAGVAGLARVCMMGQLHPTNMLGMEMTIIAAVVLGGTSITGGVGTLTGAMLGISLLTIVQNSLLLMGIPTFWQSFFTGMLIVIGTGVSAMQVHRSSGRQPSKPMKA